MTAAEYEVHYVEVDLPPIQTGLIVHIKPDPGPCMAAVIVNVRAMGEVDVHHFLAPGRNNPYPGLPYRFEPGGMSLGTYHRLGECPERSLNRAITTLRT